MKSRALLVLITASGFVLAGCGEKPQVIVYKQGKYQGKPDEKPWENSRWSDKSQWETALKTRTAGQNEYLRAE